MRIILSPAKKMNIDRDSLPPENLPRFLTETEELVAFLQGLRFDELNKYFTISNMPVVSSQYWNSVHGTAPGEAEQDEEGLQTVRVLARNASFLMKSIALGKEQYGFPKEEEHAWTNFI